MSERYDLVPINGNEEEVLDRISEVMSKAGVTLKDCLDTDAFALSASDMRYFGKEFYGKVPSYGVFMRYLNRLPQAKKDDFLETISEIESGRYVGKMDKIANMSSDELYDDPMAMKRFNILTKMNGVYERRLMRIDSRRKARGDAEEKGADLAMRIIGALNDADLLKVKSKVEAIDAEYKEVVVEPVKEKPALLKDAKEVNI